MRRPLIMLRPWIRWLDVAALLRVVALVVGFQLAGMGPALGSVAMAVSGAEASHCACCEGAGAETAVDADADPGVMAYAAGHGDCGSCPTGQPCTDCPAGCASCHHGSGVRLLMLAAPCVIAMLDTSFSVLPFAEERIPGGPHLTSLDRPPKHALAI